MPPEDYSIADIIKAEGGGVKAPDVYGMMISGSFTEAEIKEMTHAEKKQHAFTLMYGGNPKKEKEVFEYSNAGYKSVVNSAYTYFFGSTLPEKSGFKTVFVNTISKKQFWGNGIDDNGKQVWTTIPETHNPGEVGLAAGYTKDSPEGPMMSYGGSWMLMEAVESPAAPKLWTATEDAKTKPIGVWYHVAGNDVATAYNYAPGPVDPKLRVPGVRFASHTGHPKIVIWAKGKWENTGNNFTFGKSGGGAGDVWTIDGETVWLRTDGNGAKTTLWDAKMYEDWMKAKFEAIKLCSMYFHEPTQTKYYFGAEPNCTEAGFADYAVRWVKLSGEQQIWDEEAGKWLATHNYHLNVLPADLSVEIVADGDTHYFNGMLYLFAVDTGWQPLTHGVPVKKSANSVKLFQGFGRYYVVADFAPGILKPWGPMVPMKSYWFDTSTGKIYKYSLKDNGDWAEINTCTGYNWGEPIPADPNAGSLLTTSDGGLKIRSTGQWIPLINVPFDETKEKIFGEMLTEDIAKVAEFEELKASGLSEAEAQGTVWPVADEKEKETKMPEKKPVVELRKYDGGTVVPRVYYVGDVAPKEVPAEGEKKIYWVDTVNDKIYKWAGGEWVYVQYYTVRTSKDEEGIEDGDVILGNGELTVFKWGSWTKMTPVPMTGVEVAEPKPEPVAAADDLLPSFILPKISKVEKWYQHTTAALFYLAAFAPTYVKDTVYAVGAEHSIGVHWVDTEAKQVWLRNAAGKWEKSKRTLRDSAAETAVEGDVWVDSNGVFKMHHKGGYKSMMKEHVSDHALLKMNESMLVEPAVGESASAPAPAPAPSGVKLYKQSGHVIHYYVSGMSPEKAGAKGLPTDHNGYFAQYWIDSDALTMSFWHVTEQVWKSCSGIYTVYTSIDDAAKDTALGNVLIWDGKVSVAYGANYVTMDEYDLDPSALTVVAESATPAVGIQIFQSTNYGWKYYVADTSPEAGVVGKHFGGVFWINRKTGGFWRLDGATWMTKANDYFTSAVDTSLDTFDVLHDEGGFRVFLGLAHGWEYLQETTPGAEKTAGEKALVKKYKKPGTSYVYYVGTSKPMEYAVGSGHFWVNTTLGTVHRWVAKYKHWGLQTAVFKAELKSGNSGDVCKYKDGKVYIFAGGFWKVMPEIKDEAMHIPVWAGPKHFEVMADGIKEFGAAADAYVKYLSEPMETVEPKVVEKFHKQRGRTYFFALMDPLPAYTGQSHHWVNTESGIIWRWSVTEKKWIVKGIKLLKKLHVNPPSGSVALVDGTYYGACNGNWDEMEAPKSAFAVSAESVKPKTQNFGGEQADVVKPEVALFTGGVGGTKVEVYLSEQKPSEHIKFEGSIVKLWVTPETNTVVQKISGSGWSGKKKHLMAGFDLKEEGLLNWSISAGKKYQSARVIYMGTWVKLDSAEVPFSVPEAPKVEKFTGKVLGTTDVYVSDGEPDAKIKSEKWVQFWVNPATGKIWERIVTGWHESGYKTGYNLDNPTNWSVSVSNDHTKVYVFHDEWHPLKKLLEAEEPKKPEAEHVVKVFEGKMTESGYPLKVYVSTGQPDDSVEGKEAGVDSFWLNPTLGKVWEKMPQGWKDHSTMYPVGFNLTMNGGPVKDWSFSVGTGFKSVFVGVGGQWQQLAEAGALAPEVAAEPVAVKGPELFKGKIFGAMHVYVSDKEPDPGIKKKGAITFWVNPASGKVWELMQKEWSFMENYTVGYSPDDELGDPGKDWTVSVTKNHSVVHVWYSAGWHKMAKDVSEPAVVPVSVPAVETMTFWEPKVNGYQRIYVISKVQPEPEQIPLPEHHSYKVFWVNPEGNAILRQMPNGNWKASTVAQHFSGSAPSKPLGLNSTKWEDGKLWLFVSGGTWKEMVPFKAGGGSKLAGPGKLWIPDEFAKTASPGGKVGGYYQVPAGLSGMNRIYKISETEPEVLPMVENNMLQFWVDTDHEVIKRWDASAKAWLKMGDKLYYSKPEGECYGRPVLIENGKVSLGYGGDWHEMKEWVVPLYSQPGVKAVSYQYNGGHFVFGLSEDRPKAVPAGPGSVYWISTDKGSTSIFKNGVWQDWPKLKYYSKLKQTEESAATGSGWAVSLKGGAMYIYDGKELMAVFDGSTTMPWGETWTYTGHLSASNLKSGSDWMKTLMVDGEISPLKKVKIKDVGLVSAGGMGSITINGNHSGANLWADGVASFAKGGLPLEQAIAKQIEEKVAVMEAKLMAELDLKVSNAKVPAELVAPGGWSVPKDKKYDLSSFESVSGGDGSKGAVLDAKGGKDVSVAGAGAILEPGDVVMVGAKVNTGQVVTVAKVVYFTHADKYYAAYKLDGIVYSALPSELVLLEKGGKLEPF